MQPDPLWGLVIESLVTKLKSILCQKLIVLWLPNSLVLHHKQCNICAAGEAVRPGALAAMQVLLEETMRIRIYKDVCDWIYPIFQSHVRPLIILAKQVPTSDKWVSLPVAHVCQDRLSQDVEVDLLSPWNKNAFCLCATVIFPFLFKVLSVL